LIGPGGALSARSAHRKIFEVCMKLKVVTLRFDEESGGFDDRELLDFVGDETQPREVLDVSEHFFVHDRRPTWALLLSYRDIPRPGEKAEARKDWRADLDGRSKQLFDQLRGWRAKACKRDGLPPYLICTNQQLAEIARKPARTKADLHAIHGLGQTKIDRWGEEILAVVSAVVDAAVKGSEVEASADG
jgi:superfamily II DNA helicase RecQ